MSRPNIGFGVHLGLALFLCPLVALGADAPAITSIENRAGLAVAVAGDVIDLIGSGMASGNATASSWPLPLTLNSTQVFWVLRYFKWVDMRGRVCLR